MQHSESMIDIRSFFGTTVRPKIRNLGLILSLFLCVGMTSCRRAAEKAREQIRIEAVEAVEMRGFAGLDLVLRVRNDTGYKLKMEKVSFDLFLASKRVVGAALSEPVVIGRRSVGSHAMRWRVRVSDPFALHALLRRLGDNDLSEVAVSFAVKGRGGPKAINISRERVPLSEFLNTFGIDLHDLKNNFEQ